LRKGNPLPGKKVKRERKKTKKSTSAREMLSTTQRKPGVTQSKKDQR